jgi:hypothetical protein
MARLRDVAKLVRSKNAGPFLLTFDILFEDAATYERAKRANVLTPEVVGRLYHTPPERVQVYAYDAALALKATIPRPVASGDLGDGDIYGGQQLAPLLDLQVPDA